MTQHDIQFQGRFHVVPSSKGDSGAVCGSIVATEELIRNFGMQLQTNDMALISATYAPFTGELMVECRVNHGNGRESSIYKYWSFTSDEKNLIASAMNQHCRNQHGFDLWALCGRNPVILFTSFEIKKVDGLGCCAQGLFRIETAPREYDFTYLIQSEDKGTKGKRLISIGNSSEQGHVQLMWTRIEREICDCIHGRYDCDNCGSEMTSNFPYQKLRCICGTQVKRKQYIAVVKTARWIPCKSTTGSITEVER